jgi:hypothetical protein
MAKAKVEVEEKPGAKTQTKTETKAEVRRETEAEVIRYADKVRFPHSIPRGRQLPRLKVE